MAGTISVTRPNDQGIAGFLQTKKWNTTSITYSFPADASFYGSNYGNGETANGFESFSEAQQSVVRSVFGLVSAVSNLDFTEITESADIHADLRFAMSSVPSTAYSYGVGDIPEGGDGWVNSSNSSYKEPVLGSYALHSLFYASLGSLGLKSGSWSAHFGTANYSRDSLEFSVMSSNSYVGADNSGYVNEYWGYPQSLMMYDIAGLQYLYGADFTTNASDTTYRWNPNTGEMSIDGAGQGAPGANRVFMTVWDGGGEDTYNFADYKSDLEVDLRPGEWTTTAHGQLADLGDLQYARGNIANALLYNGDTRSLIENATGGGGDDRITGNHVSNRLVGGAGNDTLIGLAGSDDLTGGKGFDLLSGGAGADTFNFSRGDLDMIYDWNVSQDRIGMTVAGTRRNYREERTTLTNIADASEYAETHFADNIRHVFLYNSSLDTGWLISNLNRDGFYDTHITLQGAGSASDMAFTSII